MTLMPRAALLIPATLFAGFAQGQSELYTFLGSGGDYYFGIAVAGAGDVNADGFDDLIVGAPGSNSNGEDSGRARVLSGADGSELYAFEGPGAHIQFGYSVDGAGDVDADGYGDLMVGSPYAFGNRGLVWVLSGRNGSLLYEYEGSLQGDFFGRVSGAGDVNADGAADFMIGAWGAKHAGVRTGVAWVYSGKDGSVLHTLTGHEKGDEFGTSVGSVGDLNGDGHDDVIVGEPGALIGNRGRARVFSGADGSVLLAVKGEDSEGLGLAVSGAGDVDGDGTPDVIVSAYGGRVQIVSGANGSVLAEFTSPRDSYPSAVSGGGDFNGDGFADAIVGFYPFDPQDPGSAVVLAGPEGAPLFTLTGEGGGDSFGYVLSEAGDVDGDGFSDLIVGAAGDDDHHSQSGSARVVSGCSLAGVNYCPGELNSTGLSAAVRAGGSLFVEDDYFVLRASHLPVGELGLFLVADARDFVPGPGGSMGNLCLGGVIGRFPAQVSDLGGQITHSVHLTQLPTDPQQAAQPGETWYFQAWYRDAATSNFSDATVVTFR